MGTGGPSALVSPTHPPAYADELLYVSIGLSSRTASREVLSPLQSLTSVFGMGTGGPSAFVTLTFADTSAPTKAYALKIEQH